MQCFGVVEDLSTVSLSDYLQDSEAEIREDPVVQTVADVFEQMSEMLEMEELKHLCQRVAFESVQSRKNVLPRMHVSDGLHFGGFA